MILHIIKKDAVSYDICEALAYKLCDIYGDIVIRIINDKDKDTILKQSTSDGDITIDLFDKILFNTTDNTLTIAKESTVDEIIQSIKSQLDTIIKPREILWAKNEKGWWYRVDGKHNGGVKPKICPINKIWYFIGADYYMKIGWQPANIEDEATCLYFDTVDGHMVVDKDKIDMPDPLSFPYEPVMVKNY